MMATINIVHTHELWTKDAIVKPIGILLCNLYKWI
jgi:hypothetical protein